MMFNHRSNTRLSLLAVRTFAALVLPWAVVSDGVCQDTSAPAILQMFESTYENTLNRSVDIFYAGYGGLWIPPTGRADSGDQSVGYDVFDRYDLGSPTRHTLYGTETGLRTLTGRAEDVGFSVYADFIPNHSGFRDASTPGFLDAGDYPQFVTTLPGDVDGDYHGRFDSGDEAMRLAGLIDFDQRKDHRFIRQPVAADSRNLPAGTFSDQPDANNARFYQDRDTSGRTVFDPRTGQNVTLYDYNPAAPLAGDAVVENANDVIHRNARWLIQEIGVDGLRIDASRHFDPFVLDLLDVQLHDADRDRLLDGSRRRNFSFSETFSGDYAEIQARVRKENLGDDVVGGNRDGLDFPLFFALRDNLTGNGLQNDWRSVKNASFDINDDGLANNGSQGVAHVQSHDEPGPELSNVAHAFTLLRPGNSIVYFNAEEFGDGRDFPKGGRGDALGGRFGDAITTLVDIRNTHGRGNYIDRTPGGDEKETLIYEREKSALVVLSNRTDGGFDSRTVQTSFDPGTYLVELTGNAQDASIDPFDDFPSVVQVNNDGTVNLRVLRNRAPGNDGAQHNSGYLVYGLAGPQGNLSLSNVDSTMLGSTPTNDAANGTTRLGDVDVIKADSFNVTLNTNAVNLLGSIRDRDADGDAAYLKLDGGRDVNGNSGVDFVTPGSVLYGFENFADLNDAGFFNADGNGTFEQSIDTTQLAEGYHFLTTRAFRHRDAASGGDGGPAVFSDFKRAIYVDRLAPETGFDSFRAFGADNSGDNDVWVRSLDKTADSVHVFLNLGAAESDASILARALNGEGATDQLDLDIFKTGFFGIGNGNNALTVVTFEPTGTTNVQRLAGLNPANARGAGLGDINFDGSYSPGDLAGDGSFEQVLYTRNVTFNAAADVNADGLVDNRDLFALREVLVAGGADQATRDEYRTVLRRRGNVNQQFDTDAFDIDFLFAQVGSTPTDPYLDWLYDLNVDGDITDADVDTLVRSILGTEYGDTNLDGAVDLLDLDRLGQSFGMAGTWINGDFTGDGQVNLLDLDILGQHFGTRSSSSLTFAQALVEVGLAAAVPEPTVAALLAMGLLLTAPRRRASATTQR